MTQAQHFASEWEAKASDTGWMFEDDFQAMLRALRSMGAAETGNGDWAAPKSRFQFADGSAIGVEHSNLRFGLALAAARLPAFDGFPEMIFRIRKAH